MQPRWIEDPVAFWETQAKKISWSRPWRVGLATEKTPFYQWFQGGLLNAAYNCLDVHVEQGRGELTALIFDSPPTGVQETYTYRRLRDEVARFAGALSALSLTQGDTVLIHLPAIPETVIAMLACARLGVTHCVVRDTGGYLTALRWATEHVFGVTTGDVFWTDSHPGWVMGHSFTVYGALITGCGTVVYETSGTFGFS